MHLANSREKEKKRGRGNELDLRQRVQVCAFQMLILLAPTLIMSVVR